MMSQTGNLVILLALLLTGMFAEEDPEPIFRALGGELEMGFCFGDHIAAYRVTPVGRQLLGESSNPVPPPEPFKGRINITDHIEGLLGLKIMNLQFSDSGIYIRECKSNGIMENYRKYYLYVCGKELIPQEISLTPGTGADLECNVGASKVSETTVKWYREVHNTSLFLDTEISLEPSQEDFKGLIQARDKGYILHVSDDLIKDRPHFFCQVMEGQQCLSFQTIGLPEEPDMKSIYRSVGENVVLPCSVDHLRQNYWETPLGPVNSSKPLSFKETGNQMFVSNDTDINYYSLVIRSLTSDHSGNYKCISTFLVEEYTVNVCPLRESTDLSFFTEDKEVSLTCSFITKLQVEFVSILWFRKNAGEDFLIVDSGDSSLPMPDDLKGRATFSKKDSSLVITNPKEEDSGTYWCVVLLDNEEEVDHFDYDNNDDASLSDDTLEEDEEKPDEWLTEEEYMDMCLYRQVTNLRFQSTRRYSPKFITIKPTQVDKPKTEPETETSMTMYAVCGGVIALVVLCLIGIVVGLKMRAKKIAASNQRSGLELSAEQKPLRSNSTR